MSTSREPHRYGTLTRDRIVDVALRVVDDGGVDALTMRRVATELGVGTMSLYRHVTDRDEMLDLIAERLAASVEIGADDPTSDWPQRVGRLLRSLRAVAHEHPRAFQLLAFRPLVTEVAHERVEASLGILEESGLDRAARADLARTLISYVNGFVMAELHGTTRFEGEAEDPDAQFDAGVDVIIRGATREH